MAQKNQRGMMYMDIKMECRNCGQMRIANLEEIIKVLIETVEADSVYAGFFCRECADEILGDDI